MDYEKINIISNLYTINLIEFRNTKPLSYAFLCFEKAVNRSGYNLIFVNQDKNRVYFKLFNKENRKFSYIMDIDNSTLLTMDMHELNRILENFV